MKIMISVVSKEEALLAYKNKAQLIDIKNPIEGSLGAQNPIVIKEIVDSIPHNIEISATVGDVPFLPCTVAQAVYAVASLGVDYVKLGLKGCKSIENVKQIVSELIKAIKPFKKTKLIIGCYADYKEAETLSPLDILKGIGNMDVKGILIDTLTKDGRNLFDFLREEELEEITNEAHKNNLLCALAGSIKLEHIDKLKKIGADISGVRGAICENGRMGRLLPDKIEQFVRYSEE